MLKNSAIRRIVISSLALGVMLLLCLFPSQKKLDIPSEVIYIQKSSMPIYTINKENYVARAEIVKNNKDVIPYIINTLTIGSNEENYLPSNFLAVIPKGTKLLSYSLEDNLLKLDFSKEFLNVNEKNEEKLIESLIYSLCELDNVKQLMIFIEGEKLLSLPYSKKSLPLVLDKNYGINKVYAIDEIKNITKTTVYYTSKYNDETYYIPITKITNDQTEPVEIIIKELKTTPIYETNLISYLNASYELKDYEILEDQINLSFDNKLLAGIEEKETIEKVKFTLSLSLRDTYNIDNININA